MDVNSVTTLIGAAGSAVAVFVSIWTLYKDIRKNRVDATASITKTALELATFRDKEFDDCRGRLEAAYAKNDALQNTLETTKKLLRSARAKIRELGEDTAPFYPIKGAE